MSDATVAYHLCDLWQHLLMSSCLRLVSIVLLARKPCFSNCQLEVRPASSMACAFRLLRHLGLAPCLAEIKLCMFAGFLQKLQTYDKDNIPPEVVAKIRPYMDNPDFEPEVVKKASKAAFGLVSWVRAMEAYDRCIALSMPV